jgi:hypothetical protein
LYPCPCPQVLSAIARYHSSTVPVDAVRVLFRKLLRWPLDKVFPAVDVLRVLLTHPDGSEAVAAEAASAFLRQQITRIATARTSAALRPVVLLTARALGNAFASEGMRALVSAGASDLLDCTSDLLQYDNAPVKAAACTLLQNVAHLFYKQQQRAGSSSSAVNPDHVDQLLALVAEGLTFVKGPEQAEAAAALLSALGTAALLGPRFAATARSLELPAAISRVAASVLAPGSPAAELAAEVLVALRER